jgi:hypothetical protein
MVKTGLKRSREDLEMLKNRLGGVADFSYWQCYEGRAIGSPDGPIAQLDRVTDFYSVGCRFESCWDRQPFFVPVKRFLRRVALIGPCPAIHTSVTNTPRLIGIASCFCPLGA